MEICLDGEPGRAPLLFYILSPLSLNALLVVSIVLFFLFVRFSHVLSLDSVSYRGSEYTHALFVKPVLSNTVGWGVCIFLHGITTSVVRDALLKRMLHVGGVYDRCSTRRLADDLRCDMLFL